MFEPIRAFFKHHGFDVDFVSQLGSPAELIATMAEREKFDLIVMGSHGHGLLAGLLTGSVTTKVLALCKTPVLLVR